MPWAAPLVRASRTVPQTWPWTGYSAQSLDYYPAPAPHTRRSCLGSWISCGNGARHRPPAHYSDRRRKTCGIVQTVISLARRFTACVGRYRNSSARTWRSASTGCGTYHRCFVRMASTTGRGQNWWSGVWRTASRLRLVSSSNATSAVATTSRLRRRCRTCVRSAPTACTGRGDGLPKLCAAPHPVSVGGAMLLAASRFFSGANSSKMVPSGRKWVPPVVPTVPTLVPSNFPRSVTKRHVLPPGIPPTGPRTKTPRRRKPATGREISRDSSTKQQPRVRREDNTPGRARTCNPRFRRPFAVRRKPATLL